jgi:hypothetical protein
MPEGDLRSKIAPLGRRLLSREVRMRRATGLSLARSVADRRRPRALEAATRLAVGRSLARREPATVPVEGEPSVELPDYISPFAASVLFGDEHAADTGQAERYAAYQHREEARWEALRTGAVPRGQVQEGPATYEGGENEGVAGSQFRLARRPTVATSPAFETSRAARSLPEAAPETREPAVHEAAAREELVVSAPATRAERAARAPVPLELRLL